MARKASEHSFGAFLSPGDPTRPQEAPGHPRMPEEARGDPRRPQNDPKMTPGDPRRPQEAISEIKTTCFTRFWESTKPTRTPNDHF